MIEKRIEIETPDGAMTTFVFHPDESGPFPLVLYLMDAPSVRPALRDMASRLASAGYYVLLPFLYYRNEPYREFGASDEDMHRRRELMNSLSKAKIVSDAGRLMSHAEKDDAAKTDRVGVVGFCMSGPFALAVAEAFPDRVTAAASIHGAWFVTDKPDSSHANVGRTKAELYFAWADDDPTATPADREVLKKALDAAGARYRIEDYPGARHGFAPFGHQNYDRAASERHWERVHALFSRNLR